MRTMRIVLAAAAAVVLLTTALSAPISAQLLGSSVQLMQNFIGTGSVLGTVVQTWTRKNGLVSALSRAQGIAGEKRNQPVNIDSCVRMGRMSEVLVAYAAEKLRQSTGFAKSLDEQIFVDYMPNKVAAVKPGTTTPLTYKMLMTHTSTISDANFAAAEVTAPTGVPTLDFFVKSYFVSGSALNGGVFVTGTPGTASAFLPARANTALLAFVLEQVLVAKSQPYANLKDYISREVLLPFGMASTFWLDTNGNAPGVTPTQVFSPPYGGASTTSTTLYAEYFTGCLHDKTTGSFTLHPAWPADHMGFTTVGDVSRLAYNLLISTANNAVALPLREKLVLEASATSNGQVAQALGLQFFDGDALCTAAKKDNVVADCPLSNASTVLGFAATAGPTSIAFFCTPATGTGITASSVATTDATTTTTTSSSAHEICVSTAVLNGATTTSVVPNMQLAGVAFQEAIGTVTLPSVTTPAPSGVMRSTSEENIYGISVLFGSFLTFVGVVILTFAVQKLLLPVAMAGITDTAATGDVNVKRDPANGPM